MAFFEWRRDVAQLAGLALSLAVIASMRWHWPPVARWSLTGTLCLSGLYVLFTRHTRRAQVLVLLLAGFFLGSALLIDYVPMSLAIRKVVGWTGLAALGAVIVVLVRDKRAAAAVAGQSRPGALADSK